MNANTFGSLFSVTSFGESHGPGLGAVVQGCPAGIQWQDDLLQSNLARRRPGHSPAHSARKEADHVEVLSGVYKDETIGTPIALIVKNTNPRSQDYEQIKTQPRPGHADDLWQGKYVHWDHRGGGRASGRETVARVLGGSVAQMLATQMVPELIVDAKILSYGPFAFEDDKKFEADLIKLKNENDSCGGVVDVKISHCPSFLGQPVFRKLKSDLSAAFMSVGAVNGVEFGGGFNHSALLGSEYHNQPQSLFYGGLRGGLSTGETMDFRVSFKPTSSIGEIAKKGRHDPCILARATVVLESMAWLVLADHLLMRRLDNI